MLDAPEIKYARSGDYHIAYHVVGDGPLDLIFVHGWASNIGVWWEEPHYRSFLERLGSFARVIVFDKRGTGLSDPVPVDQPPMMEQRMDDLRAVMDAVGVSEASIFSISEGGAMSILFTATYPERVTSLVIWCGTPRIAEADDWPLGVARERGLEVLRTVRDRDFRDAFPLEFWAPTAAGDPEFQQWYARAVPQAASPAMYVSLMVMNGTTDVRGVLPTVQVPTLVLHRTEDEAVDVRAGRYLAEQIPGARYLEVPGHDHWPWVGDVDQVIPAVQEFLTGARPAPSAERVLSTVLFTDIVGSTERAVEVGDADWREILDAHDRLAERTVNHYRGRLIKNTGDGILATFDGPGRGIRAAQAIQLDVQDLDLKLRAGLHTGEIELRGEEVSGIGVHIAARIAALAGADEVLTTSTVRDLVAGSGLEFAERGRHELKGVPGEWQVLALVA